MGEAPPSPRRGVRRGVYVLPALFTVGNVFCGYLSLDEAVKSGLLGKSKPGDEPGTFRIAAGKETLAVERMDGKVSNPAPFFKDMLGWNRRAIHITLPNTATDAQADAACKLLVFGAKKSGALA